MLDLAKSSQADLIICPFLTKRVPQEVWNDSHKPCLIVHPGIEGDRGMTSLEWAIKDQEKDWGVTVMAAAEEMDAGDIWSTQNFIIDRDNVNSITKSSLYVNEVTNAAVHNCLQAIENFTQQIPPRGLDYSKQNVRGRLRPNMKKADRLVDWNKPAEDVARHIRMSDSSPGSVAKLRLPKSKEEWSEELRVFGAHIEEEGLQHIKGHPGEIIGKRDNALLVKCGSGAVWLSHLKKNKLKLPAAFYFNSCAVPRFPVTHHERPVGYFPRTFQEIWTTVSSIGVCEVNFEFYNGAMSTEQCQRLVDVLRRVEKDERVQVIVLKGGFNFFGNGIHLNVIESSRSPADESWRNINAINDVVKQIYLSKKVTISAVQGNAGAGGAMKALAGDVVLSRDGVVFNPHYKSMKLYGSEYHTYFLPQRVGSDVAQQLLNNTEPLLAARAVELGFLDACYGSTHREFDEFVKDVAKESTNPHLQRSWRKEKQSRTEEWLTNLEEHRRNELNEMVKNFESQDYHEARKAFVYH